MSGPGGFVVGNDGKISTVIWDSPAFNAGVTVGSELLAVNGPTNEAKGDGDAATWLPPNKRFRCTYIEKQVAVKATYGLWVTPAEHDAMARILKGCTGP